MQPNGDRRDACTPLSTTTMRTPFPVAGPNKSAAGRPKDLSDLTLLPPFEP